VEDLDNQIALLHSRAAALDRDKAALTLAQIDFNRAKQLLGTPR
jgi:prefoldin subunit 5